MKNKSEKIHQWITSFIFDFVNASHENLLWNSSKHEKIWDKPLVGISSGDDFLYKQIKKDIGEFYLTPIEIFNMTFPELKVCSSDLSVISWVLPQNKNTKLDNAQQALYPSERWVRARKYGENFNKKIAKYLIEELGKQEYKALSPMLSPYFKYQKSESYGYASTWSERHAAYISGLGTFGLCDGLITKVGKAMRCGSIVINIQIEPMKREYNHHNEYCLYYSKGICMECARRCPVNAVDEKGHDKIKCREYQREVISKYTKEKFNIESSSCGLCQAGVPCESEIPKF